jgi:hypothetical protein
MILYFGRSSTGVVAGAEGAESVHLIVRNVESIKRSTAWSIGEIMSGTEASPAAVGNHLVNAPVKTTGDLVTANRDAFTIIFIVAPGIVTLASDCHISVSTADTRESNLAVGDPTFVAWP